MFGVFWPRFPSSLVFWRVGGSFWVSGLQPPAVETLAPVRPTSASQTASSFRFGLFLDPKWNHLVNCFPLVLRYTLLLLTLTHSRSQWTRGYSQHTPRPYTYFSPSPLIMWLICLFYPGGCLVPNRPLTGLKDETSCLKQTHHLTFILNFFWRSFMHS